jgi:hypothetical protein
VKKKMKIMLFVAAWAIVGIVSLCIRTQIDTPLVHKVLFPGLVLIEFVSLIAIFVYGVQRAEETIKKQ